MTTKRVASIPLPIAPATTRAKKFVINHKVSSTMASTECVVVWTLDYEIFQFWVEVSLVCKLQPRGYKPLYLVSGRKEK